MGVVGPRAKAYPGICLGFVAVWPELCVPAKPPEPPADPGQDSRAGCSVGEALGWV